MKDLKILSIFADAQGKDLACPAPEGPIRAQTLPLLSDPEMLERICFSYGFEG